MKSLLSVILIVFFSTGILFSQSEKGSDKTVVKIAKFDPARDAAKDIENAIKEATKTHKRIILDIGGEWCIWCHRLDSLFIKNPDLYKYMNEHFVYVKVNMSPENRNKELLSKYPPIPGYPHWFVLDSDGKLLKSESSGEFEEGKGHSPKKVMAFLKEWTIKS
jgi:thioredoxin-related protein